MQRRLAAILAADVVGYSRMMGRDEAGTLERLTRLRTGTLEPLVCGHGGRIVKLMGDGFLVEFSSLVDAVHCARDWHARAQAHGVDDPAEAAIRFRIGINIGDVLIDGDDIFGDGVNIAARLESLAEPGGTCLSGDAYRQVRGKTDIGFEDMGDQALKNIEQPIRVYRTTSQPAEEGDASGSTAFSEDPSIAVLPFASRSDDPEQDYFADGITEDIITDLSKRRGLLVIARHSTFAYKGQSPDIRQVCRDLGVQYILEGSVRKAGSRVRITAQLVEGERGAHLWAERYDRDLSDIFSVQDEVTREIVRALEVKLIEPARERPETGNPQAYDLVLRGREQYRLFSSQGNAGAGRLFEQAIDLDANYTTAIASLALVRLHDWFSGQPEALDEAYALARKVCDMDPSLPLAQEALGNVSLFRRDHDEAIAAAERWIALEPGSADAYANLAGALMFSGEPERVIALVDRAITLNPFYPFYYVFYKGMARFCMEELDTALRAFERSAAHNPEAVPPRVFLAACLGFLGRPDEAAQALAQARKLFPKLSIAWVRTTFIFRNDADLKRLIDGLRRAGFAA